MRVIGFTGQARCGKSYLSDRLAKAAFEAGQRPHLVSFAGALKQASADAGFPKDTHPTEYREFCQTHGAEMRAKDPNYWVNKTVDQIRELAELENKLVNEGNKFWEVVVIIDDVRYQNEIDTILRMGGDVVHVTAGDRLPVPHARFRRHESEKLARAIDRTKGTGKKFESIFSTEMPWGETDADKVYWFDNSGSVKTCEKMINTIAPLLLGTQLLAKSPEETQLEGLSEEEREALIEEIQETLNELFDGVDFDGFDPDKDDGWDYDSNEDPDVSL